MSGCYGTNVITLLTNGSTSLENLIILFLGYSEPNRLVSWKPINNFLSSLVNRPTNKVQTLLKA